MTGWQEVVPSVMGWVVLAAVMLLAAFCLIMVIGKIVRETIRAIWGD